MYEPSPFEIKAVEAHFDEMEQAFRSHFIEKGVRGKVSRDTEPGDVLEVTQFAFGLMAAIFRSGRAVTLLTREGFGVEARPIWRSLLDQIIALYSVKARGIFAVHAYGKELAYSYKKLLEASATGFPFGNEDELYIRKFIALAENLPWTTEHRQAENAIKTKQAAIEAGPLGEGIYQMWLEATPLSKPSMRLVDNYMVPELVGGGIRMNFLFDGTGAGVDLRLVLSTILPVAMVTFAEVIDDAEFGLLSLEMREKAPRPRR